MQIHSTSQTGGYQGVQTAGCLHGQGAGCPICHGGGGGGGGGGSPKRNTAGLMTWNEAWAVWNALKVNNTRKTDGLQQSADNQIRLQQDIAGSGQRSLLLMTLSRWMQPVFPVIRVVSQGLRTVIDGTLDRLTSLRQTAQQAARGLFQTLTQAPSLLSLREKLTAILGDNRKFLEDLLQRQQAYWNRLKARLNFFERMTEVGQSMEKALRDLAKKMSRELRNVTDQMKRFVREGIRWLRYPRSGRN